MYAVRHQAVETRAPNCHATPVFGTTTICGDHDRLQTLNKFAYTAICDRIAFALVTIRHFPIARPYYFLWFFQPLNVSIKIVSHFGSSHTFLLSLGQLQLPNRSNFLLIVPIMVYFDFTNPVFARTKQRLYDEPNRSFLHPLLRAREIGGRY